jgi:phage/plasmid-like protein (TIGR03299 family)
MVMIPARPWQQVGTTFDPAQGYLSPIEAVRGSEANFEVKEAQLRCSTPGSYIDSRGGGDFIQTHRLTTHKALYRADTGKILSVVGSKYKVIQTEEAFSLFEPFVTRAWGDNQSHTLRFDTIGVFDGGARVWAVAELLIGIDEMVPGDEVWPYLVLQTGHDGRTPLRAMPVLFRPGCENQMPVMIRNARGKNKLITIRHTRSAHTRIEEAKRVLRESTQYIDEQNKQYKWLAQQSMTTAQWDDFLLELVPPQAEDASRSAVTRTRNRHALLTEFFEAGDGTELPGVRGTRWAALNAVTQLTTHRMTVRAGVSKESPTYEKAVALRRLDSSWSGSGAALNQRALELLAA